MASGAMQVPEPARRAVGVIGAEPLEDSSGETIDLAFIIREKPKTKVVREFMRENLAAIQGDDEVLFGGV